jgi:RNA polymerase sigma factor (sigma-70 family)
MPESTSFPDFIRRIRAGDDQAARELVERYEPVIRCEVRLRLRDPRLYSRFDWTDICQSVMASFFVRVAVGQYELEGPEQLVRLLVSMARNKLAAAARLHYRQRRDIGRTTGEPAALAAVTSDEPTPSRVIAGRELLAEVNRRLSEEERLLAELRADGCAWTEIAARLGGTAEARRKQLARAVDRVERLLEGSEIGDD